MANAAKVKVWDIWTRLFHWSLAGLIAFAWWSVENHHLDWHKIAGSVIAGLLVFRLWWGVFGGSTARFADFVKGPGAIFSYLGGKKPVTLGHNPLGALSVLALLLSCAAVVGFGLFASDTDGLESGPFASQVNYDQSVLAGTLHGYAFEAVKWLVVLHLLAIAYYAMIKREPLLGSMIHGQKPATEGDRTLKPAGILSTLIGLALGAATTWALIKFGG
ncbi:MAG TPA: cytochrome b/b6 domain-containing protein [Asticcacaulis sp.]|nr:cytochrome b/b6 domain-containing protein [Asticcacaulis sp.]